MCFKLNKISFQTELISRSPQELYEIVCLIGELMPKLPTHGMFAVDSLLEKPSSLPGSNHHDLPIVWQWRDDRSQWHPYSPMDCRIIEVYSVTSMNFINENDM